MRGRVMLVSAAFAAVGLAGCTSSAGSAPGSHAATHAVEGPATHRSASAAPDMTNGSSGAPSDAATASELYPGAAVLAGDAPNPPHADYRPTGEDAQSDFAGAGTSCQTPQSSAAVHVCRFGARTGVRKTIAVVGDSVGGQWVPALARIARTRHWRILMIIHSRCPFSSTMTVNTGATSPYTSCHDWGAAALEKVLQIEPDAVLTADRPTLGTPDYDAHTQDAYDAIAAGMADYWRTLLAHHIAVIAMRESPEMGQDEVKCLKDSSGNPRPCYVHRSDAIIDRPPDVVAAGEVSGAVLVDMSNYLCAPKRCSPVVGNVLVYRDEHHVTATYVRTTAPYLAAKLRAVTALR